VCMVRDTDIRVNVSSPVHMVRDTDIQV